MRSRSPLPRIVVAGLLAVLASALLLSNALAAGPDVESQARDIARELQCPVCQGSSVADSPSPLAEQMRGVIRQKLEQGESRDAIISYFVERYGQKVLMAPPISGFALSIWLVPALALGAAALGIVLAVRSWSSAQRRPAASAMAAEDDPADDGYREQLRRALESEGEPAPR